VSLVIIYLRKRSKLGDFFKAIHSYPESIPYLEQYGRENDHQLLRDFYFMDDRHASMGYLIIEDAEYAEVGFEDPLL
jgi:hypothetical protein